ncbi:hypothetical protein [Glycomyces salinus]|uniref:hypothetical protein n=1 Tax=Glycomyces salinus TaxID=980294 RepID=UPI0018EC9E52|nr:hypothetical protein [Glycomyces salinus]
MKFRAAPWMSMLVGVPFAVIWLLMVTFGSEVSFEGLAWLYGTAVAFGFGLLVGLIVVAMPTSKLVDDRIMIRSRYGWTTDLELQEGDRWVIVNGRVCMERSDGTLKKSAIARWALAGRDWKKLEGMIPTVDRRGNRALQHWYRAASRSSSGSIACVESRLCVQKPVRARRGPGARERSSANTDSP